METVEKSEEEIIADLKEKIAAAILTAAKKVNLSAVNYMVKEKKWIPEANANDAESFFTDKISAVLTKETAEKIYEILGLLDN